MVDCLSSGWGGESGLRLGFGRQWVHMAHSCMRELCRSHGLEPGWWVPQWIQDVGYVVALQLGWEASVE